MDLKSKIYLNRDELRGLKFNVSLFKHDYEFKIEYVRNDTIKISKTFKYSELRIYNRNSVEYVIKRFIYDNSNFTRGEDLNRIAMRFANTLKSTPLIIDDYEFNINYIGKFQLTIEKFISYDELFSDEYPLFKVLRENIVDNLVDNPKIDKKQRYSYGDIPYLFDSFDDYHSFTYLKSNQTHIISEKTLERNRKNSKMQLNVIKRKWKR